MQARIFTAVMLAALAYLPACSKTVATNVCKKDADCTAPGTRCDVAAMQCVCSTNEACGKGEFCNHSGVCQGLAGCSVNADCTKPNTFCDISSGTCLDGAPLALGSNCGLAEHCPF